MRPHRSAAPYTINGLALLTITVGLAVYDARTLGCLLMAYILSAAIGISIGERNAHNHHSER